MILGLDLGTATGFAFGDGGSTPIVGNLRMPVTGDDVGAFLAHFRGWIVPTIRRLEPDLVAFEAPILVAGGRGQDGKMRGTNITTTRKLQGLAGLLELMCLDLKVPCFEVQLNTAKKALTGYGHADKGAMLHAARSQGLDLSTGPEAFDEADAFAVWLVAVQEKRPQFADAWARRLGR